MAWKSETWNSTYGDETQSLPLSVLYSTSSGDLMLLRALGSTLRSDYSLMSYVMRKTMK